MLDFYPSELSPNSSCTGLRDKRRALMTAKPSIRGVTVGQH